MTNRAPITISDSLAYYFKDGKNGNAIRTILDQKKVPVDLSWDDLEQYNLACLAAEQVRVDYWRLSLQVWRATWGQAFDADKMGFKEAIPEDYEGENQLSFVWDKGKLYLYFNHVKRGFVLFLFVSVSDIGDIGLSFYLEDPDKGYDISNSLSLSNLWNEIPDDDMRFSAHGLASLSSGTTIDLTQLQQAANDAVSALNKQIVQVT